MLHYQLPAVEGAPFSREGIFRVQLTVFDAAFNSQTSTEYFTVFR